jgi:Golgi SNAP receptor complex protein 2
MLSELLPEEKRRLHELEQQLIELEHGNSVIQTNDITIGLEEMANRLDELDKLVQKESKLRKEDYRRRVQHLRTMFNTIKTSLVGLLKRKEKMNYSTQRRELFAGARTEEDKDAMALELAENGSLDRSGRMMNDYISVGQETLSELVGQKERLKNIQRKVFDIMNYLGLANSIMKSVDGRESVDKYIVYAGMALITMLIFAIWFFLKR